MSSELKYYEKYPLPKPYKTGILFGIPVVLKLLHPKIQELVNTMAKLKGSYIGIVDRDAKLYIDNQNPDIPQPASVILSQTGSLGIYGTALYGTGVYSAAITPVFKNNLVGAGTSFALEFSTTDTNGPYRIDDITITYSLKGYR